MGQTGGGFDRRSHRAFEPGEPSSGPRPDADLSHSARRKSRGPADVARLVPMVLTLLVIFCLVLAAWVWVEILWPLP
jgi:hypothetical protein